MEEEMNEEILKLRTELADVWEKENRHVLKGVARIEYAKLAFMHLPVSLSVGRTSFDILWDNYKHYEGG